MGRRVTVLCLVLLALTAPGCCTWVGFLAGNAVVDAREERLAARPTAEERAACRAHRDALETREDVDLDASELPDCSSRGIREARRRDAPSSAGTIAGWTLAGVTVDALALGILYAVALSQVKSH